MMLSVRTHVGRITRMILGSRKEIFMSPIRYVLSRYFNVDFSLFGMQSEITALFSAKSKGVFLELGAADGIRQSNTALLEYKYGWRGVLIEPQPEAFMLCRKRRKNSIVVNAFVSASKAGILSNSMPDANLQNQAAESFNTRSVAPVIRIQEILDVAGICEIDFVSIDVEGAELDVLQTIDFGKTYVRYVLVETDQSECVSKLLAPWFKPIKQLSFHDYLYANLEAKK